MNFFYLEPSSLGKKKSWLCYRARSELNHTERKSTEMKHIEHRSHSTSSVRWAPIGPVKVSFLTKLRKTGFAATRMPFLISQRQDLQQSPTTLRESTQLACWHVRGNRILRWQDWPLEPYGSDGWSHYFFECLLCLASERGASTAKVLKPKTRRTYFGNLNESIPAWPILLTALASSDTETEILPTSLSGAGL